MDRFSKILRTKCGFPTSLNAGYPSLTSSFNVTDKKSVKIKRSTKTVTNL